MSLLNKIKHIIESLQRRQSEHNAREWHRTQQQKKHDSIWNAAHEKNKAETEKRNAWLATPEGRAENERESKRQKTEVARATIGRAVAHARGEAARKRQAAADMKTKLGGRTSFLHRP